MSDLVRMTPEDHEALAQQMKLASTQAYKGLLDALEPYCDGSMGPVSPAHVNSWLKVRRELNLLWHAYDRPVERVEKGQDEEQMVLAARQEAVLAELQKLREIGAKRRS